MGVGGVFDGIRRGGCFDGCEDAGYSDSCQGGGYFDGRGVSGGAREGTESEFSCCVTVKWKDGGRVRVSLHQRLGHCLCLQDVIGHTHTSMQTFTHPNQPKHLPACTAHSASPLRSLCCAACSAGVNALHRPFVNACPHAQGFATPPLCTQLPTYLMCKHCTFCFFFADSLCR